MTRSTGSSESKQSAIADPAHNVAEFSVSEIAGAVKTTLEGAFSRVRVRGEISRPNYHSSGHLYLTLKDENAVIDGVCWRGTVNKLSLRVEEGMEVICTGRISSYPRSSKYQLVIDSVELAGEGALLKLLEDRRKKLAAEGLFDDGRKRDLPFLPGVIGVITSPTGAVIRDILHRLEDRFPRHVLLWPVVVQGDAAAGEIAAAINGFNALIPDGPDCPNGQVPRPDVLIVGRGGGSLEDLWAFNEEIVVRAAASSDIPLISAVGHETDTTLIDFAADRRAPTPTAAAEMAVPVRAELIAQILDDAGRLQAGWARLIETRRLQLDGLARGLPDPRRLLEQAMQDVDIEADRLKNSWGHFLAARASMVAEAGAGLRHPREQIALAGARLGGLGDRLGQGLRAALRDREGRYSALSAATCMAESASRMLRGAGAQLEAQTGMLESLSYRNVLARGYAVVRDSAGGVISRADAVTAGQVLAIDLQDGILVATAGEAATTTPGRQASSNKRRNVKRSPVKTPPAKTPPDSDDPQGQLL